MSVKTSQITGISNICSTNLAGQQQSKHQSVLFCGIFLCDGGGGAEYDGLQHKEPVMRKRFEPCYDVIVGPHLADIATFKNHPLARFVSPFGASLGKTCVRRFQCVDTGPWPASLQGNIRAHVLTAIQIHDGEVITAAADVLGQLLLSQTTPWHNME